MSRWTLALLALLTSAPHPSRAASPLKACLRGCRPLERTCLLEGGKGLRVARASCTGTSRRACIGTSKRIFKGAKRTCRTARAACRTCCRRRGTGCAIAPEAPIFSGRFTLPDRRALETAPLPPGPGGRGFVLLQEADGIFYFDPAARSPISAAAECAAAVLACYDPALRNRAGCFAGVPTCATDTPWVGDHPMCCARACGERYQERRREGMDGPHAFAAAVWAAPSCMPGFRGREAKAGTP
jgi:hypothetical protein